MKSVLAFSFNWRPTSYHKSKHLKPLDTEIVQCPGTHVNHIPVITKASAMPSPRTISLSSKTTHVDPGGYRCTTSLQSLQVCSPMPCLSPSLVRLRMLKSLWTYISSCVMSTFWGVADVKSENHYDPHKSRSLISRRCSSTTSQLVIDRASPGTCHVSSSWNFEQAIPKLARVPFTNTPLQGLIGNMTNQHLFRGL